MSSEKPVVLVVEDEAELANLYGQWLSESYQVRIATSGAEALQVLDDDVAVVLLDRRMPEMSGDELLDTIEARGLSCRVAMVTAVEPDIDIIELGFDEYLTKPVSAVELRRTVDRLLALRTYHADIQAYYALASKIAVLQAAKSSAALNDSDEYQQLQSNFESVQQRANRHLRELLDEEPCEWILARFPRPTPRNPDQDRSGAA